MPANMTFIKALPSPFELQEMFPLSSDLRRIKADRDKEIQNILSGKDSRMLLIIGPCSADNEDSVLDYMHRLTRVRLYQ